MACLAAERLGRAPSHGILPPGSHASRVRQAGNAHSCTPAGPSFPRRGCGVQEPVPNCHQRPPLPTPHWDASPASVCHHGAVPVTETLSHPVAAAVGLFLQGGGSRQWGSHAWGAEGSYPGSRCDFWIRPSGTVGNHFSGAETVPPCTGRAAGSGAVSLS